MTKRDQHYYHLIAALHDQLEDIETYDRYLKDVVDNAEYARVWTEFKARSEEAVTILRQEIRNMVGAEPPADPANSPS